MLGALLLVALAGERVDAGVGVEAAHFTGGTYRTGEALTLLPGLRVTGERGLWGGLVAPVHYLTMAGDEEFGLGDLRAGFGYAGVKLGAVACDAGLWTRWPVGDPDAGLGSGQLILAPELEAILSHPRWVAAAQLTVRGAIGWGEHGLHHHQSLVDPYDLLDLQLLARGGIRLLDALELCALLEPVVVFIPLPTTPVGTRMIAGASAALRLGAWRAELAFAAPLTVNRAFDWRLSAGFSVAL